MIGNKDILMRSRVTINVSRTSGRAYARPDKKRLLFRVLSDFCRFILRLFCRELFELYKVSDVNSMVAVDIEFIVVI